MTNNDRTVAVVATSDANGIRLRFSHGPMVKLESDRASLLGDALIKFARHWDRGKPLRQETKVAATRYNLAAVPDNNSQPHVQMEFGEQNLVAGMLTFKHNLGYKTVRWLIRDDEGEAQAPLCFAVVDENTVVFNLGDAELRGETWVVSIKAIPPT